MKLKELKKKTYLIPKYFKQMGVWQTLRFLLNAYGSKKIQKYKTKNCIFPIYLWGKTSDIGSFDQIFISEEYNLDFSNINTKNPTIIDAGANCGYATLYFKSLFPKSKIIMLEPEKSNIEMIKKNIQNSSNIHLEEKGLWINESNLTIINKEALHWSFRVVENKKGSIKGISIDSIMSKYKINSIDILKMDIEGSEKIIFQKSQKSKWPSKVSKIIVEPHDKYILGCKKEIINFSKRNHFNLSQFGENLILKK